MPITGSAAATHAVVVIHGTGRNAAGYFASMMSAATKAGVVGHTLVIAPWFKTRKDKPNRDEAVWTSDGWKQGDAATNRLVCPALLSPIIFSPPWRTAFYSRTCDGSPSPDILRAGNSPNVTPHLDWPRTDCREFSSTSWRLIPHRSFILAYSTFTKRRVCHALCLSVSGI
jgi:hypothetical protein